MDEEKNRQDRARDVRVTNAIVWFQGVMSVLFTATVIWLANTTVEIKSSVAVLLSRPEGISRAEYTVMSSDVTRKNRKEAPVNIHTDTWVEHQVE